jgi:hypothetical protein
MKTDELPKIGLRAQLSISANHYVVYVSKCVATEYCKKPSWWFWYQMRNAIYEQVENNVCKRRLITNENI